MDGNLYIGITARLAVSMRSPMFRWLERCYLRTHGDASTTFQSISRNVPCFQRRKRERTARLRIFSSGTGRVERCCLDFECRWNGMQTCFLHSAHSKQSVYCPFDERSERLNVLVKYKLANKSNANDDVGVAKKREKHNRQRLNCSFFSDLNKLFCLNFFCSLHALPFLISRSFLTLILRFMLGGISMAIKYLCFVATYFKRKLNYYGQIFF